MTPEREKAMERVAQVAREMLDINQRYTDHRWLYDALAALDALPAEPTSGEGEASERTEAQKWADSYDHLLLKSSADAGSLCEAVVPILLMALRDDIHQLTAAIREGKR